MDPTAKEFDLGKWDGKQAVYWAEVLKCELLCHEHHVEETSRQWEAKLLHSYAR
jgi:hypothetical protein